MYNERVEELNVATQERDDLKKHYDGLRKKRQANRMFIHAICILCLSFFLTRPGWMVFQVG